MQTRPAPSQPGHTDTALKVERIGPDRRLAGAERIVGASVAPRSVAARRFLEAADRLNMDLSNMWGVFDETGQRAKQVCLAVVGSGRTAMLFVSGPPDDLPVDPDAAAAARERSAVIEAACTHLAGLRIAGSREEQVVLAQALLEPEETEAVAALSAAGFMQLGELAYLRRNIPRSGGGQMPKWPAGITVRRVSDVPDGMELLPDILDRSYIDTLDCPELCGMREVGDVLESHRSVGVFDAGMWWLVYADAQPEGCMLLSSCPEQDSVELVYLGLSPRLRGKGLGRQLLTAGIQSLTGRPERTLTCAVDTRNAPAMSLYRRCGFQRFATRVPLVRSLRRSANGTCGT